MRLCLTLLLAPVLLLPLASLNGAPPLREDERATRLVTQLESDDFQARQAAAVELDRMGVAALPSLQTARKHHDPEVRRHAAELLQGIERRLETGRLLDAVRLSVKYDNVPLGDVLADLSKRSGNPIRLDSGVREEVAKRPITLTGEWTFWEAFARVCAAGGLTEPEPEPPVKQDPSTYEEGFRGRRRVIFLDQSRMGKSLQEIETLTLIDGSPAARPTFQTGAMRFRVFAPRVASPLDNGGLDSLYVPLTLEIKPEPRITWERLAVVRIERVIDDRGQELTCPNAVYGESKLPDYIEDTILMWDGHSQLPLNTAPKLFGLSFKVSERTGKSLREINGTAAGWIRTAPVQLIAIEDLGKVGNKVLDGPESTRLKVAECTREEDGLYKMKIEVTPPRSPHTIDSLAGRVLRVNRRMVEKVVNSVEAATSPFVVLGVQGEALELVNGTCEHDVNGPSRVYTLVFKPDRNDKGPMKLTYRDRRSAFVEIPFTLKDVPLYKDR